MQVPCQSPILTLPMCVYLCARVNTPAGERVPCDGEVIDGLAAVDESMLTGESVLVAKGVGAAVAGGCIVFEGPLTIKASATGAESTLAGQEGWETSTLTPALSIIHLAGCAARVTDAGVALACVRLGSVCACCAWCACASCLADMDQTDACRSGLKSLVPR